MTKSIYILVLSIICCFSLYSNHPRSENKLTLRNLPNLEKASDWFIEQGFYHHHKGAKLDFFKQHLLNNGGLGYYGAPDFKNEDFLARFIIKAAGVNFEIFCLHRVKFDKTYEYWNVQVSGYDWAEIEPYCYFIITKSDDEFSKREIIKKEEQFFESFVVDKENEISFPTNNLGALYFLSAWTYPESYKNFKESDLLKYKIVNRKKDEYKKVKLNWFNRKYFN